MNVRSVLIDVAVGRRKVRVFEAGDGAPLVFLHGAGGLTEESRYSPPSSGAGMSSRRSSQVMVIQKVPRACATCSRSPCIRLTSSMLLGSIGLSLLAIQWAA